MKPDAIYYFERIPGTRTRYRKIGHKGKIIPDFPSVYKKGKYKGEKYIVFRKKEGYYNQSSPQFSHTLELARSQIITWLIFMPERPLQSYGDYNDYGLLIELSEDSEQLTVWFFKGLQEAVPLLFQKWLAGQIPEVTKSGIVTLKYGTDSSHW
ncbi:hypothetical protein K7I13_05265 [Brucepastera parasyntrophica]|uniref:hypothetical protein n=1 Tax=Brucepastera parasyntrophica TaxID=2880008 RepID=UPI00210C8A45|nr:hypothetical protein [Brucepastera parasyntrophica]ULQ60683.1 hypothetical protein K7I13_05265 [Brucepastera parasyntrophica]